MGKLQLCSGFFVEGDTATEHHREWFVMVVYINGN